MKTFKSFASFVGLSQITLASTAQSSSQDIVTLEGYGSFTGTTVNTTYTGHALPAPVDAWLGIDYALQPVGARRFQPVSSLPAPFDGVREAAAYGKACVQDASYLAPARQDEACLNFNVYRTQGVPLDQKLPVLVWIHGGAFVTGSWKSFDGAAFAASSTEPIVVVSFHYRLNSLGSLPSALFEEEGLLNLGLRDQAFFLKEIVQKHIASFGGDPEQVTIGGRSAGGHSVGIHYFHNYNEDAGKPYFARAIHQSGSITARAFPNATYPLYVSQFTEYMSYLNCPTEDRKAAMDCLRAADIGKIREISTKLYEDSERNITWPFQPTQGGPLLEKFGSQSGLDGTFFRVPVLTSNVNDEGKYYLPGDLETNAQFIEYMHNGSPALNAADLARLAELYPDPATETDSPFAHSYNSTQYDRLAAAWSDYGYICPGQETAYRASLAGVPTWKLRFNTNASWPAWEGIPHTSDTKYTWDEPTTQHRDVSHVYHAYLASFVTAGDPNTHRYPGSPFWPGYEVAAAAGEEDRGEPGMQLVVEPDNGTRAEPDVIRREACLFWRDPERAQRLNK
ncbi:para-nitrobenzyl esterase [Apiospora arundinis]|uniref:Carboxylic ester hydrolase n=1 Tax=Apiospora arundinis TaxID=335852 RepID=A0ABR2IIL4_9PEZI